jgi:hypothetical protein
MSRQEAEAAAEELSLPPDSCPRCAGEGCSWCQPEPPPDDDAYPELPAFLDRRRRQ